MGICIIQHEIIVSNNLLPIKKFYRLLYNNFDLLCVALGGKHLMKIFLETKRLILKPTELSDFDNLFALRSDPEVMKYIGDSDPHTAAQIKRFLRIALPYQKKHGIGFCSVFEKESGNFIGQAGLFHIGYDDTQPDIETAYRLHKKFWGKGYATELAKALIQWGFQHLSIN